MKKATKGKPVKMKQGQQKVIHTLTPNGALTCNGLSYWISGPRVLASYHSEWVTCKKCNRHFAVIQIKAAIAKAEGK